MNRFNRQLDWVTSLKGDAKIDAGSVIHWQGIYTTVNLLVVLFNQVNLGESAIDTRGEREIQIKKMIVGLFYEMDGCLDFWATQLVQKGRLTKNIESKKKVFKKSLKVVGVPLLKEIRNALAFHFTDYISQPDALIATYRKLDKITLEQLNAILKAAMECGFAMREQAALAVNTTEIMP